MTIGCNIWMICLKLNWFFYGLSRILQFSQFVWTPCYSVWDVFNNFLLVDATDRSKISSDQKRFFIALSLYPLSFFANTPFKEENTKIKKNMGHPAILNYMFLSTYSRKCGTRNMLRRRGSLNSLNSLETLNSL